MRSDACSHGSLPSGVPRLIPSTGLPPAAFVGLGIAGLALLAASLVLAAAGSGVTQIITYGLGNFATLFLMREKGMTLGDKFDLKQNRPVTVVGVFDAGGSSFDSEIWVNLETARSSFGRAG